ncbi:MAG: hypothetical protein EOP52_10430 [Sphingobacteriales bacterium]|nr:MAG: hypothetical protein EOP52_10430 [Sphingobacteriales bacterium]
MIDTITAYQDIHLLGITENELMQHVSDLGAEIVWGHPKKRMHEYAKFRVWLTYGKVMIQGSLCKLYFGNNLETLNRRDTKKAVEKLEKLLGLPLEGFTLSRLDFSENIPTDKNVGTYIQSFEGIDKWKTEKHAVGEDSTGKYFKQSIKHLLIYDKAREIHHKRKKRNWPILDRSKINPNDFRNKEREDELLEQSSRKFLRIEYRYVKNVSAQLKRDRVSPLDLSQREIYFHLVREWFKVISKIHYREEVLPDLDNINNISAMEDVLMKAGVVHLGGKDAVLKGIRGIQANTPALKSRKSRFAQRVKKISSNDLLDGFGKELFLEIRRKAVRIALKHLEKRPLS